jgi:hypothetical protein
MLSRELNFDVPCRVNSSHQQVYHVDTKSVMLLPRIQDVPGSNLGILELIKLKIAQWNSVQICQLNMKEMVQ